MKIAIVRGDFASPWELQSLRLLAERHRVTLFTGLLPIATSLSSLSFLQIVKLPSPVDLNFGRINRYLMSALNRFFVDAHILVGLEGRLRGFDIAYCAETYYFYSLQCVRAKELGYVRKVASLVWENIPFNNEGIWGRKWLKRRVITGVDKFVAVTDMARDVLIQEGCDPAKIVRANPGVDLSIFKSNQVGKFRGLKKNKNLKLLFVGRLIEEKGVRDILQIFSALNKKHKNIELVVAGSGPLAGEVEKHATKNKNIHYLGSVSDYQEMPKLYSLCDIYVHYSKGSKTWLEQYGFTLIEAMACGLPVVGLDRGSVKEVVREGGFVVNKKDYPSVLEKLIVNTNLRKEMAKKALHTARKHYDAYKYGQELEKIFTAK